MLAKPNNPGGNTAGESDVKAGYGTLNGGYEVINTLVLQESRELSRDIEIS